MKDIEYHKHHTYLYHHFRHLKKKCDICGLKKENLEFALKFGHKYSRDINDYIILCKACHITYDVRNLCQNCGKFCRKELCVYCGIKIRSQKRKTLPFLMNCRYCGKECETKFKNKQFCSTTCRIYSFYRKHGVSGSEYIKSHNKKYNKNI